MTSKFSQNSDVQSLPPVCHAPIVIPPGWIMPLHHPIKGLNYAELIMQDSSIKTVSDWVTLKWRTVQQDWYWEPKNGYLYGSIIIDPHGPDNPMQIFTKFLRWPGSYYNHSWWAPPYDYPNPWKSGDHEGRHLPYAEQVKQTFYQLF